MEYIIGSLDKFFVVISLLVLIPLYVHLSKRNKKYNIYKELCKSACLSLLLPISFYGIYLILTNYGILSPNYNSLLISILAIIMAVLFYSVLDIYKNRSKNPSMFGSLKVAWLLYLSVSSLIIIHLWGIPVLPLIAIQAYIIVIATITNGSVILALIKRIYLLISGDIKRNDLIALNKEEFGKIINIDTFFSKVQSKSGKIMIMPTDKLIGKQIYKISDEDNKMHYTSKIKIPTHGLSEDQYDKISLNLKNIIKNKLKISEDRFGILMTIKEHSQLEVRVILYENMELDTNRSTSLPYDYIKYYKRQCEINNLIVREIFAIYQHEYLPTNILIERREQN